MEAAASSLSSLLSTLRVDGPWTPPGTWESVTPESGAARAPGLGGRPHQEPIYEVASVSVSEIYLPTYLDWVPFRGFSWSRGLEGVSLVWGAFFRELGDTPRVAAGV